MDQWFDAARMKFGRPGEYPLIDDETVIDGDAIFDHWPGFGKGRNLVELWEEAHRVDQFDPAIRFVYLNLFYRLAHYPVEDLGDFLDRQDVPRNRQKIEGYLQGLVQLVEVEDCKDARQVRWEIVNACAIRDWDRANRLYVRLEEVENHHATEIAAMRGRFECLSVFAEPWGLFEWGLPIWMPRPQRPAEDIKFLNLTLMVKSLYEATVVHPTLERDRLEDAALHLSRAVRDDKENSAVYRFLLLRCRIDLGKFREAAADCESLLTRGGEFGPIQENLTQKVYEAAINAYEADGQIDQALTLSERWLVDFPKCKGVHERRSRIFARQLQARSRLSGTSRRRLTRTQRLKTIQGQRLH